VHADSTQLAMRSDSGVGESRLDVAMIWLTQLRGAQCTLVLRPAHDYTYNTTTAGIVRDGRPHRGEFMLRKFCLVALIALGCAGCARDRPLEVGTAGSAVVEPTRTSETEQPAQVRRDAGAAAGSQAQPQLQPQPQGVPSRTAPIIQTQPVTASRGVQDLPTIADHRHNADDCQNGRASGQSGDCQHNSEGHGRHGDDSDDHPVHPPDHYPDSRSVEEYSEKPNSKPPRLAEAPSGTQKRVNLLFYHMPQGCPHCAYERPQIAAFQKGHGDVTVDWRPVGTESARERELLRSVSGHPIIVFYTDDGDKMLVRGEASTAELDRKLTSFRRDVLVASQNGRRVSQTTGSNIVCQ
jgi:hypothetical protein